MMVMMRRGSFYCCVHFGMNEDVSLTLELPMMMQMMCADILFLCTKKINLPVATFSTLTR